MLKPKLPEHQQRFLSALATWMNDQGRTAQVSFDTLVNECGLAKNTARKARQELEAAGKLTSVKTGNGPGSIPIWTVACLPEKGVSDVDPSRKRRKGVSDVDLSSNAGGTAKGVNGTTERGQSASEKGSSSADLPGETCGELNRRAKPSSSAAAAQTAKDQGQGQEQQPKANSQNRRVHLGPETVADRAQQFPPHNSESPAAGCTAREGKPAAPARRCEFSECYTPDKALPDNEWYHIGCGLAARRAERAAAEAVAS